LALIGFSDFLVASVEPGSRRIGAAFSPMEPTKTSAPAAPRAESAEGGDFAL
jgi:hypothetical protein